MILTCKYSYDLNPNEPVYAKNVNTVNTYTSVIIQALGGGLPTHTPLWKLVPVNPGNHFYDTQASLSTIAAAIYPQGQGIPDISA